MFYLSIFGCVESSLLHGLLSSCCEWGLLSSGSVWASHCSDSWATEHGLSSCGAQAQLLCGMWDVHRPGIEPVAPAVEAHNPNHWTIKEVLALILYSIFYIFKLFYNLGHINYGDRSSWGREYILKTKHSIWFIWLCDIILTLFHNISVSDSLET